MPNVCTKCDPLSENLPFSHIPQIPFIASLLSEVKRSKLVKFQSLNFDLPATNAHLMPQFETTLNLELRRKNRGRSRSIHLTNVIQFKTLILFCQVNKYSDT